MKIQAQNFLYSPNFSARKKEIKDADLILRNAKRNYPMASDTYMEQTYGCLNEKKPYYEKSLNVFNKTRNRVSEMRARVNSSNKQDSAEIICAILNESKQNKIGNCLENAQLALAALYANGYTNSKLTSLEYKTTFIDKETKETVYEHFYPLDHMFVVTDMKKGSKGGKTNIVVDPWLSFADSISGARERFKKIYKDENYINAQSCASMCFVDTMIAQKNIIPYIGNYDITGTLCFSADSYEDFAQDSEEIQKTICSNYPELIILKK